MCETFHRVNWSPWQIDTLIGTRNLVAVARSALVDVRGKELGRHMQVGLRGHVQLGHSLA